LQGLSNDTQQPLYQSENTGGMSKSVNFKVLTDATFRHCLPQNLLQQSPTFQGLSNDTQQPLYRSANTGVMGKSVNFKVKVLTAATFRDCPPRNLLQ